MCRQTRPAQTFMPLEFASDPMFWAKVQQIVTLTFVFGCAVAGNFQWRKNRAPKDLAEAVEFSQVRCHC